MVYRVECRPLFRTVWSAAALRLGNKRFALAIVFHVGGGLGMRKVTPQPEMSTPSRVYKHGSMGSCWLQMVTGRLPPLEPLSNNSYAVRQRQVGQVWWR